MDFNSRYKNFLPYPPPSRGIISEEDITARANYDREEVRIYNLFKADALEEVGLTGHPRAEKAFSYAWSQGHAHGYSEVFGHLQDIAEVLID